MTEMELSAALTATLEALEVSGLDGGFPAQVSARIPNGAGFIVPPKDRARSDMTPEWIVPVGLDGRVIAGVGQPAAGWPVHRAAYAAFPDAGAVIACASPCAAALSCTKPGQKSGIPAFHTRIADLGGADIRCAAYATPGTDDQGTKIVAALRDRRACLLPHEGQLVIAPTLDAALALAKEVEKLAEGFIRALCVGGVRSLDAAEMARVAGEVVERAGNRPWAEKLSGS